MSSEEFCTRLIKEARVALVPGVFFGAEGFVRLSYCCSMEDIVQGLESTRGVRERAACISVADGPKAMLFRCFT